MILDIREVKEVRKQLGLTQAELARHAGVSQSLIAKVEAQSLDPTYSNAQKIFKALSTLGKKQEAAIGKYMQTKIVSILPSADLKDAVAKMKKHGFSSLPVIINHQPVGMVSESILLDALLEGKKGRIEEVMASPPPLVAQDTALPVASGLLRHVPMVLVSQKGRIVGLVTKSDLLSALYSR